MAGEIKSGSPVPQAREAVRNRRRGGLSVDTGRVPWYLKKRVVFPLALIISILTTVGFCWWHIPVTNQLTGERENMGTRVIRASQALVNPQVSLETAFSNERQISVLLVGLDHIPPSKLDPGIIRRSDCVMVATTDFDTRQIRLVSIPRDGWVQHWQNGKNFGYERLANTYSLGQERNLHDPLAGLHRTRESVAHLLDMPLDFYIVIEFEGLVKMVDCLGGLEVDVEMDMNRDDNAGNLHIHLKKGLQHLSGEQVVHYARYRDPRLADLGRMPRQQKVVRLLLEEMMKGENLAKLPELARIAHDSVKTNFSLDQLIALAQHIDMYAPDSFKSRTVTSYYDSDPTMPEIQCPGVPAGTKVGAQCIYPRDAKQSREFLLDLAVPEPEPEPEGGNGTAADEPATDANSG